MIASIFQDWQANDGNLRSRLALAAFRLAQAARRLPAPLHALGWPALVFYVVFVEWMLGIELNPKTEIGPGLRLYHGVGLVIHERARIGAGCTLRHCTTIGNRSGTDDVPVLGDGVEVGCNAVILGAITIGSGARIAAGAVVLKDVPPGATAAGNPARIIPARTTPKPPVV